MGRMRYWSIKACFSLSLFLVPVFGMGDATLIENQPGPIWKYFHPAWAPSGFSPLDGSDLAHLASDPSQRLDKEFRVPKKMRDRVLFWTAVYSRYTTQMRVLHDRKNPSLIYGYLDFSALYQKYSAMGAEITAQKIERQVREHLENALLSIASQGKSPLSDAHQDLFQRYVAWHGIHSKVAVEEAVVNLRSQTGQRDVFETALARSDKWLPKFEKIFAAYKLPKGLTRIPFIESSFNPDAKSKAGAMGLWQFMPKTAKEMIHPTNRKRWTDPMQQALGAASLLKRYRRALPDWSSTVTSYNSGIGRVSRLLANHETGMRVIHATDTDGELGFAGKSYYAEFLAANIVEAYRQELFGKSTLGLNEPKPIQRTRSGGFGPPADGIQG